MELKNVRMIVPIPAQNSELVLPEPIIPDHFRRRCGILGLECGKCYRDILGKLPLYNSFLLFSLSRFLFHAFRFTGHIKLSHADTFRQFLVIQGALDKQPLNERRLSF